MPSTGLESACRGLFATIQAGMLVLDHGRAGRYLPVLYHDRSGQSMALYTIRSVSLSAVVSTSEVFVSWRWIDQFTRLETEHISGRYRKDNTT